MAGFPGTVDRHSLRAKETQRNNFRRNHMNALADGLTANHVALCMKRCNNNKLCHMLTFKFDPDKKDQRIPKGAEQCVNRKPGMLKVVRSKPSRLRSSR